MNEQAVFTSDLQGYLPCRFYERLGFYISYGAADLRDDHVSIRSLAYTVNEFLGLVGYVRYHLHR